MKWHFFTKGDRTTPSARYRAFFVAEELQRRGYITSLTIVPDGRSYLFFIFDTWFWFRMICRIEKNDIVFLQRTIYNKAFLVALLLARFIFGRQYIFDIDDAVFLHSPWKTALLVKHAVLVTCGSDHILQWASMYTKCMELWHNTVPLDIYTTISHSNSEAASMVPVIGWIGNGPAHIENLKLLVPVLKKLVTHEIPFVFRIIGTLGDKRIQALFETVSGATIEYIDYLAWDNPTEAVREIQKFWVGVMPLLQSSWNNAKYFKTIEYMACGVPPVVSLVGENGRIIETGVNGFTANTTEEWYEALKSLLINDKLRTSLSHNAQISASSHFSLASGVDRLITLVHNYRNV